VRIKFLTILFCYYRWRCCSCNCVSWISQKEACKVTRINSMDQRGGKRYTNMRLLTDLRTRISKMYIFLAHWHFFLPFCAHELVFIQNWCGVWYLSSVPWSGRRSVLRCSNVSSEHKFKVICTNQYMKLFGEYKIQLISHRQDK
jgi:hypothetical protein